MTADEIIYYALIAMIPLTITGLIILALRGRFDDETRGYEDDTEYRRRK